MPLDIDPSSALDDSRPAGASSHSGPRDLPYLRSASRLFAVPASIVAGLGILAEVIVLVVVLANPGLLGHAEDMHGLIMGGVLTISVTQTVGLAFSLAYRRSLPKALPPAYGPGGSFGFEHGLGLGAVVALAGLGVAAWVAIDWIAHGFGSFGEDQLLLVALSLIVVGAQIFFMCLWLSLLMLSHRNPAAEPARPSSAQQPETIMRLQRAQIRSPERGKVAPRELSSKR